MSVGFLLIEQLQLASVGTLNRREKTLFFCQMWIDEKQIFTLHSAGCYRRGRGRTVKYSTSLSGTGLLPPSLNSPCPNVLRVSTLTQSKHVLSCSDTETIPQ